MDDLTIDFVIIGLILLCFGWFCLILLCPLVWLICSLKTQIFNLPRAVKFLASNLRQFQAGKINFTAKSAKFKQNLINKLCCFLCLVLLFCWFVCYLLQICLTFMTFIVAQISMPLGINLLIFICSCLC